MCELCTTDPEKQKLAREGAYYRAKRLELMAAYERDLADGNIKPHSESAKRVGELARYLIRYLVEDWL